MSMVPAICTQCGANVEVDNLKRTGKCHFCGTEFVIQEAINHYTYNIQNATIIRSDADDILAGIKNDIEFRDYTKALNTLRKNEDLIKSRPEYWLYLAKATSANYTDTKVENIVSDYFERANRVGEVNSTDRAQYVDYLQSALNDRKSELNRIQFLPNDPQATEEYHQVTELRQQFHNQKNTLAKLENDLKNCGGFYPDIKAQKENIYHNLQNENIQYVHKWKFKVPIIICSVIFLFGLCGGLSDPSIMKGSLLMLAVIIALSIFSIMINASKNADIKADHDKKVNAAKQDYEKAKNDFKNASKIKGKIDNSKNQLNTLQNNLAAAENDYTTISNQIANKEESLRTAANAISLVETKLSRYM